MQGTVFELSLPYCISSGKHPCCCDAAEAIEAKKGDLTIRAMLRHDDPALLEKLRHQPLVRLLRFQGSRLVTHVAHLPVDKVRAVHCIARAVQHDAPALKVVPHRPSDHLLHVCMCCD